MAGQGQMAGGLCANRCVEGGAGDRVAETWTERGGGVVAMSHPPRSIYRCGKREKSEEGGDGNVNGKRGRGDRYAELSVHPVGYPSLTLCVRQAVSVIVMCDDSNMCMEWGA